MKKNLMISILYTLVTTVLLGIGYPLVVTGFAQLIFPKQANGELIQQGGKLVGSHLIGQPFTAAGYFYSRPSAAGAAGYDPSASSGSNLGPTNKALQDRVSASVQAVAADESECTDSGGPGDDFRFRTRPGYFSGVSGISGSARGERTRHERSRTCERCVQKHTLGRQFGFLGEARVNVLELNLDLDAQHPLH